MDKSEWYARMRGIENDAQAGRRVGRGTGHAANLLDDDEQNIGRGETITAAQNIIIRPVTNPPRILNLKALSPRGRMVTIAIAAQTQVETNVNTLAGPLIGLIETGNGGVFSQRLEVDLQPGTVPDFTNPTTATSGVVFVSVPSGTLRVYARHDGNLVTPNLANSFGNPLIPGSPGVNNQPRSAGPWTNSPLAPIPALVLAYVCYEPRFSHTRNTRTVWVYNNTATPAVVPGQSQYYVPPLAKTVQIYRRPVAGVTVTVGVYDHLMNPAMELFTIAAGANSPVINLPNGVAAIGITTDAAVESLALVFEVGF